MSIELKQAAEQALKELDEARKIIRASSSRQLAKDWDRRATDALANLRTAIQQPATPEPVQADSSEYLRVIASLGAALRRLSFTAQTTGGTAGPDAELQSAIGQAEQALSLGSIGQAMFATTEPVAWNEREQLRHAQAAVVMPMIGPLLDAWENSDREVMSQEPELSKQLKNINSAMEDADTRPAPSVPDEKPLPDLMMASYHEAIGWNACRAAMLAAAPAAQVPSVPATSEPVLTVEREPDYWSGGHFYEGNRPHINPTKIWSLPIGTELYTHPPSITEGHHQDVS